MIRRNFLRQGVASAVGAGIVLSGVSTVFAAATNGLSSNLATFSIDIVSDNPVPLLNELGQFLSLHRLSEGTVKVQMTQLAGEHVTDAVFIRNAELIDFRASEGRVEDFLSGLSERYAFRRSVETPTLIRFSGGDGVSEAQATTAQLFVGNMLVDTRTLGNGPFEQKLESSRGSAVVRYDREGLRVVDASCKHKTCVNAGAITNTGESIVCIPGRIRIVLTGEGVQPGGVHAVTR